MSKTNNRPRRQAATIIPDKGATARVILTRGLEAVVDKSDVPLIADTAWFASPGRGGTMYARRSSGEAMHRVILGLGSWNPNCQVDHINGDGLDNRRANLRVAGPTVQKLNERRRLDNTSGEPGVHLRPDGTWQARISVLGKRYSLGHFQDYNSAARCRRAVREIVSNLIGGGLRDDYSRGAQ